MVTTERKQSPFSISLWITKNSDFNKRGVYAVMVALENVALIFSF